MKRRIVMLLAIFSILLGLFCVPVSANSPPGGAAPDNVVADFYYFLIAFAGLMITLATETFLALLFPGCVKHTGKILITNLCSQMLMHAVYLLLQDFWAYSTVITIVLEVMIYTGEYFFYRYRIKNVPKLEILIYTLSANTLSLASGILMLWIL